MGRRMALQTTDSKKEITDTVSDKRMQKTATATTTTQQLSAQRSQQVDKSGKCFIVSRIMAVAQLFGNVPMHMCVRVCVCVGCGK